MSALRSTGSQTVNQLHTPLVRALFPPRNGYRNTSIGNEYGMSQVPRCTQVARTTHECLAKYGAKLRSARVHSSVFFCSCMWLYAPSARPRSVWKLPFFETRARLACMVSFFRPRCFIVSFAVQNERHRYCLFRSRLTTRRFWHCSASRTSVIVLVLTFCHSAINVVMCIIKDSIGHRFIFPNTY